MKTFLKNIFDNLLRHLSVSKSVEHPAASLRVVEPFVTKSNRYKPDELSRFLNDNYRFRFNLLSEVTEYQSVHSCTPEYVFLGEREMNTICIEAFNSGICCRDRDVKRYIRSTYIETYHPFHGYLDNLPEWDGIDRIIDLSGRVSATPYWKNCFHRWMLALTAQWMGLNRGMHANSIAPLLISTEQGRHKSTFCKLLVPASLQAYYTDQFDISEGNSAEVKLALMGLINLDEFDRLSVRKMAQLKNLMQMPSLNVRKAYKKNYCQLPRIASFIGTSNRKDLLTDPTGSRRFICVDVENMIDCTGINHDQLYAQLKHELLSGVRYWFTTDEEADIQRHNEEFYRIMPEEEIFRSHFRAAASDEACELLSLADILEVLREHHRGLMRNINLAHFGSALVASGVERLHTREGNRYRVVRLGEGREG
jgi:hypothetical protein